MSQPVNWRILCVKLVRIDVFSRFPLFMASGLKSSFIATPSDAKFALVPASSTWNIFQLLEECCQPLDQVSRFWRTSGHFHVDDNGNDLSHFFVIFWTTNSCNLGSRWAREEPKKEISSQYDFQDDGYISSASAVHIQSQGDSIPTSNIAQKCQLGVKRWKLLNQKKFYDQNESIFRL